MTLESSLSTRVPQHPTLFLCGAYGGPAAQLWCGAAKRCSGQRVHLNVSNLVLELLQFFLKIGVLLCHLFILLLPLVALILKGLDLAFEMSGLDISLSEPVTDMLAGDLEKVTACCM